MMTNGMFARWGPLLLAALTLGCGSEADESRVAVSGKVTLVGQPLPTGKILFTPLGNGQATYGAIEDGTYSISRSDGPGPGKYRVEIYSIRPTGKQVKDRGLSNELVAEQREFVAKRYNIESELRAEVRPDVLDQTFDFSLAQTKADVDPKNVRLPTGLRR